jgi:hypothetical protein
VTSPRLGFLLGAALTLAFGILLARDALRLCVGDEPRPGRVEGCYTTVETWLGVGEPSQIRQVELMAGCGAIGLTVFWFTRRDRA